MPLLNFVPFDTDNTGLATPTFTPAVGGSSRVVGLAFSSEQLGTGLFSNGATINGVAATKIDTHVNGSGSAWANCEVYLVPESAIASLGTNPPIQISSTSGNRFFSGMIFTVGDADQVFGNIVVAKIQGTTGTNVTTNLTAPNGSTIVGVGTSTLAGNSWTINTPLTKLAGTDRTFNAASRTVNVNTDSAGSAVAIGGQNASSTSGFIAMLAIGIPPAVTGATISTPTPSGTIGTSTQATIGCTTNQNNGTLYYVASTNAAVITSITDPAIIIAGQVQGGATAPFSGAATVSTLSPSVLATGLTANTTYHYALCQVTSGGNSNVLNTGSFTTALASSTVTQQMVNSVGTPLNAVSRRFWTRTSLNGAAIDGGASGLLVTCNASGQFVLTGLSIPAGAGWLTYSDDADPTKSINIPVTFLPGT